VRLSEGDAFKPLTSSCNLAIAVVIDDVSGLLKTKNIQNLHINV